MAKKIYEIAFELAGKVSSSFSSSFTAATKTATQLDQQIKKLSTAQDKVTRFRELKKEIGDTEKRFKTAQGEASRLAKELRQVEKPTREMEKAFERAKREAGSLKDKLSSQRSELQTLRSSLSEAGVSTRNLAGDNAKLARELERVTAAKEKQNRLRGAIDANEAAKGRYRGQLLDTVAIAAMVAAPVKAAMDFESSMADVKKVVDFDTPQQFKEMEKDILSLTRTIPMTADQLAQIVAAGGQSGIEKENLIAFAESAAKMGVAFDVTADEAGQMMAGWRTAFRMNQTEVVQLADKINYLGNTTAASAPKISTVVTGIGPLGEVAGLASGEIAALGATLVGMNISEEIASTGIKNLMLGLTAGTAATKKQQEAFTKLGINTKSLAEKMQTDAKGAIFDVLQSIKKLPEAAQPSILTELFGKESVGAIAPLLTNLEELEKNFGKVADATQYAGSMQGEFEARAATSENALILAGNAAKEVGISIGSILLPPIAAMAQMMAKAGSKVAEFAEKHPGLTKAIVFSTTAVIGLKIASVALGYGWTLLKGSALSLFSAITKVTSGQLAQNIATNIGKTKAVALAVATKAQTAAQWLLNAALTANPIGLVIMLIAGLVAGLVVLYKKSETARKIMDGLWNGMKLGAEVAVNFVVDRINSFIDLLNKIKIPDWVPGIGGKGIQIEKLSRIDLNVKHKNNQEKSELAKAMGTAITTKQTPELMAAEKRRRETDQQLKQIHQQIREKNHQLATSSITKAQFEIDIKDLRTKEQQLKKDLSVKKSEQKKVDSKPEKTSFTANIANELNSLLSKVDFPALKDKATAWIKELPFEVAEHLGYMVGYSVEKLSQLPGLFSEWFQKAKENAITFISELPDKIAEFISSIPSRVTSGIESIKKAFKDLGKAIPKAIEDGFNATVKGLGKVGKWVIQKVTGDIEAFKAVGSKVASSAASGYKAGQTAAAAKHATGGILTKPHLGMVAEAGPEAIIPLSSRMRSRAFELWQETGRQLGVKPYADGGFAGLIDNTAKIKAANNTRYPIVAAPNQEANLLRYRDSMGQNGNAAVGSKVASSAASGYKAGQTAAAAKHATGGILTKPHLGMVAEAGPEAIIPLSSRMRSRAFELWQETGRQLGVKPYADGGFAGLIDNTAKIKAANNTRYPIVAAPNQEANLLRYRDSMGQNGNANDDRSVVIKYSPVININGGDPNVKKQVEQGLRSGLNEFDTWYKNMKRNEARLSY